MDAQLSTLMFSVYSGLRVDLDVVDAVFDPGTQAAANTAARQALADLEVDVRAKRSDDGLARARGVLEAL